MEIYSENDVQSEERRATCTRGKFFAPFESFFFCSARSLWFSNYKCIHHKKLIFRRCALFNAVKRVRSEWEFIRISKLRWKPAEGGQKIN